METYLMQNELFSKLETKAKVDRILQGPSFFLLQINSVYDWDSGCKSMSRIC